MDATTICFINQKGGCGKSSCCFHLGGQLAATGQRVLLVEFDGGQRREIAVTLQGVFCA